MICDSFHMSILSKAYVLVINGDLPGGRNSLLKSITEGNPSSEEPIWMQGDVCDLHLYFRTMGDVGQDTTSIDLGEDFSMILAGSLEKTPDVNLFMVSQWTKEGDEDVYYAGTLQLDTEAIEAAFESEKSDELSVLIDIEVRDTANTKRISYRIRISIARQVYSGQTVPGTLEYPAAIMTAPDGSKWQLGIDNNGEITKTKVA